MPRYKGQTAPRYTESPSILGANGVAANSSTGAGQPADLHLGVNNYLWRAALEQVSTMPLISEDPVGGVIITDWYLSPTSPNDRRKLNVYIFGREMLADSVRVAVYKQHRGADGNWVDSPTAATDGTGYQNAILARAHQLASAQSSP